MNVHKTRKAWITLLLAVTFAGFFLGVDAGPLEPPGPPGDPTMIPLDEVDPRIPIYAEMLPLTISESGSYYLAEDISTTGGGIIVQANDVTIDLMGFILISRCRADGGAVLLPVGMQRRDTHQQ